MKRLLKVLFGLVFALVLAAAVSYWLLFLPLRPDSAEMAPALFPGDTALALRRAQPARGDLVVYEHPERAGVLAVRRVVGMPGETVALKDQKVIVDGAALPRSKLGPLTIDETATQGRVLERWREDGPAGRSWVILLDPRRRSRDFGPVQTNDGYFVMADNRNHGRDSRDYGVVPATKLRGVVRYLASAVPVKGLEPRGSEVK